jgi:hypothetical protein
VARFQYVCEECGNTVPAERVEKRVPGSKAQCRAVVNIMCESKTHSAPMVMKREEYTPPRREVRAD